MFLASAVSSPPSSPTSTRDCQRDCQQITYWAGDFPTTLVDDLKAAAKKHGKGERPKRLYLGYHGHRCDVNVLWWRLRGRARSSGEQMNLRRCIVISNFLVWTPCQQRPRKWYAHLCMQFHSISTFNARNRQPCQQDVGLFMRLSVDVTQTPVVRRGPLEYPYRNYSPKLHPNPDPSRELLYGVAHLLGWSFDVPGAPAALGTSSIPPATTMFFELHFRKEGNEVNEVGVTII